ncbi:hypothetical protein, partial [Occultella aeris]
MGANTDNLEQISQIPAERLTTARTDLETLGTHSTSLTEASQSVQNIGADSGAESETGMAAWTQMTTLASSLNQTSADLTNAKTSTTYALDAIDTAREAYNNLPPQELNWWQKRAIEAAAAAGGMIVLGGVGAVTAAVATNHWLDGWDQAREDAATQAMTNLDASLGSTYLTNTTPEEFNPGERRPTPETPPGTH